MKIALIAPHRGTIPPRGHGGIESVIDGLARSLARLNHEPVVFAPPGSTCPVPLYEIPPGEHGWVQNSTCQEIHHVITAYQLIHARGGSMPTFDVIHDHTKIGPLYAASFSRLPLVVTNHSPFEGSHNTLFTAIQPWCLIVAISEAQASGAIEPVTVVKNGVDTDFYTPGSGCGDADGPYLLFIGRFEEVKGAHVAASVARKAGCRLIIAGRLGKESERNYFRDRLQPLLGDSIRYIGEVDAAHKRQLLQRASALLNPISWNEPFGLTMVEALSCGTPVIAYGQGAAVEILQDGMTGFLCTTEEDLVQACQQVLELSREEARAAAVKHFGLDRMALGYVDVYRRAIEAFGR